jgi:hypothetical protein
MQCILAHNRLVYISLILLFGLIIQAIWLIFVVPSNANSIVVDQGKLTVSAREASVKDLLEDLSNKLDIDFQIFGNMNHTITVDLSGVSLEEGLKRILSRLNYSIIYSQNPLLVRQTNIEKVIIFSPGYGNKSNAQLIRRKPSLIASKSSSEKTKKKLSRAPLPKKSQSVSLEDYVKQLSDPDPDLREDAVIEMADDYKEAALIYLEKALVQDGNDAVRVVAAEAIGELENEDGITSLEKGLDDPDEDVRRAVVAALGEIGGEKILPALRKALKDGNEDIREEAASLIEDIEEQRNNS